MSATSLKQLHGPATLSDLMGGDEARVLLVLRAFQSVANDDLLQLDEAVRQGSCERIKQIAHRLAMACYLVGENAAGSQLEAITSAGSSRAVDPILTQFVTRARTALIDSIARISLRIDAVSGDSTT